MILRRQTNPHVGAAIDMHMAIKEGHGEKRRGLRYKF